MVTKKVIAIIPARGGSKRIPKKNIIPFKGKPLMAWTIEAALESECFDKIIVSTDDSEIAKVARQFGAETPFVRNECTDDHSTVSQVIEHALKKINETYHTVVQLMPNCPLRTSEDIKNAFSVFKGDGFMLSVTSYGWLNPWWAHINDKGIGAPLFKEEIKKRSQDLPEVYCPTGAIWMADVISFLKEKTFYGPGYKLFPLPWISAIDIDNYEDLEMANLAFELRYRNENCIQN